MLVGLPLGSYHLEDPVVPKMFRVNQYACCTELVVSPDRRITAQPARM